MNATTFRLSTMMFIQFFIWGAWYVTVGQYMAKIGLDHQTDDEADFYAAKVATAKFFMDKILPQTGALFSSIMAGSGSIMDFPEASF